MHTFKSFKRKMLIRIMTALGFGGMVGFCIASCQSPSQKQNQQPEQTTAETSDSSQSVTVTETQHDNPPSQNEVAPNIQETIDNSDPVQTETVTDEPVYEDQNADNQLKTNSTSDNQPNDEHVQKNSKKDDVRHKIILPTYGIRTPEPRRQNQDAIRLTLSEVKASLIELNRTIQSECQTEPGTLKVSFTIQTSGRIVNVKSIDGTLKGAKSEKCILNKLSKHQFKKFEGGDIPVKYPFEFK